MDILQREREKDGRTEVEKEIETERHREEVGKRRKCGMNTSAKGTTD